jgi:hypothetical protein
MLGFRCLLGPLIHANPTIYDSLKGCLLQAPEAKPP